ncbi:MAG: YafY family protein [Clostridium sp.]
MKIERLISIIMLLNNKKRVTAKELSEKFEVSTKTIQRDIEIIERAGIPIVSFKGYDGGYGIIDGFKVDKSSMTKDEAMMLKQLLDGINKSYSNKETSSLMEKLNVLDNKTNNKSNRFIIDFTRWGTDKSLTNTINLVDTAILEQRNISFDYINLNGERTNRIIEPNKIVFKALNWYVYGFCTLKNEMRIFKISRMKDISITEEYFEFRDEISNDLFKESPQDTIKIIFKYSKLIEGLICENFEEYEDIGETEEHRIISINVQYNSWVESMFLSFGDKIEVLEPKFLRENLKKQVKNMMQIYHVN